jgi:hypothetical protein
MNREQEGHPCGWSSPSSCICCGICVPQSARSSPSKPVAIGAVTEAVESLLLAAQRKPARPRQRLWLTRVLACYSQSSDRRAERGRSGYEDIGNLRTGYLVMMVTAIDDFDPNSRRC